MRGLVQAFLATRVNSVDPGAMLEPQMTLTIPTYSQALIFRLLN